jgi:hypothetical protein
MAATTAVAPAGPAATRGEAAHDVYASGRAYAYAPTREGGPRDA